MSLTIFFSSLLTTLLLSSLPHLCISWGSVLLSVGLCMYLGLVFFLSITPLNLHFLQTSTFTIADRISFVIVLLTFLVIFIRLYVSFLELSLLSIYSMVALFIACLIFFSTSSLLILYISFEASLLPISYIILKWGSYQDRCLSVIYILAFTTFFSFPFIIFIVMASLYASISSGFYLNSPCGLIYPRFWVSLLVFCVFAVKLPIYGLHIWLPMAHVEAPVFGSMVLAGILLKLGGVGLLRTLPLIEMSSLFFNLIIIIITIGVILSSLISCVQSDFKRLVAYLSVVHITLVGILLMFPSSLSFSACISIMVLHGILSPMIFYMVNLTYGMFKTRMILIFHSLKYAGSIFIFIVIFSFVASIPTPPLPQFLAEVLAIVGLVSYSLLPISTCILILTFFSLLINLMWFIPIFSTPSHKLILVSPITTSNTLVLLVFVAIIMFLLFNFIFII